MSIMIDQNQTDVRVTPNDWDVVRLSTVCTLHNGRAYALHEWETSGVPVIRLQNLTGGDEYYYSTLRLSDDKYCEDGDLLFMWSATFGPRLWRGERAIFHYHIWKITPHPAKAARSYLFHKLAAITEEKKSRAANGGTMLHVTKADMENTLISLPTMVEQEAIAEALSDADSLIESLEQLIAKKRQIKQGAMQELLTGKRRLPGFGGEWKSRRLGEIALIKTGSRNNEDKVEDGEYPFFVRSATVERINSYSYECEAILVPGEGGIGNIFHYVKGRFDAHQRVYVIRQFSSEMSGKFVYFYMSEKFGPHAMQNTVKATVDSLRLPTFQNFEIVVPPTAEEQTAIATTFSDMDAEIAALETKLTKARQIKQGMMQELLTGRIRLV